MLITSNLSDDRIMCESMKTYYFNGVQVFNNYCMPIRITKTWETGNDAMWENIKNVQSLSMSNC